MERYGVLKEIIDAAQQREIIELIRIDINLQIAQLEPGGDGKNVRIKRVEAN
ncbi:hypothetical protein [Brasilonema sp. UFV-L1]|uniref:hypothetical protein n=1 Tax=Brasilonema sp. UFV-L1 TaxID=2234130 RepID=UPI0030D8AEB0